MFQRAFTLIELLVMIAIIALLMGISMLPIRRAQQMNLSFIYRMKLFSIGKVMLLKSDKYQNNIFPKKFWRPLLGRQNSLVNKPTYSSACKILNTPIEFFYKVKIKDINELVKKNLGIGEVRKYFAAKTDKRLVEPIIFRFE